MSSLHHAAMILCIPRLASTLCILAWKQWAQDSCSIPAIDLVLVLHLSKDCWLHFLTIGIWTVSKPIKSIFATLTTLHSHPRQTSAVGQELQTRHPFPMVIPSTYQIWNQTWYWWPHHLWSNQILFPKYSCFALQETVSGASLPYSSWSSFTTPVTTCALQCNTFMSSSSHSMVHCFTIYWFVSNTSVIRVDLRTQINKICSERSPKQHGYLKSHIQNWIPIFIE